MSFEDLTDEAIETLRTTEKDAVKGITKMKPGHTEVDYEATGRDGSRFRIFTRQNNSVADDFSCGIRWELPSGENLTLARYNGSSHPHRNAIEGESLPPACHIHKATERYLRHNRRAEGFAEETTRYSDMAGALRALAKDFCVSGLPEKTQHEMWS